VPGHSVYYLTGLYTLRARQWLLRQWLLRDVDTAPYAFLRKQFTYQKYYAIMKPIEKIGGMIHAMYQLRR